MSLTLRLVKGSTLTFAELDDNFTYLDDKIDDVETAALALTMRRNYLINGDFGIWQRGTSHSGFTSSRYTADRWQLVSNTNDTKIVERSPAPVNTTVAPRPTWRLRYSNTAGSTGSVNQIQQRLEDVRRLQGREFTLSFWAAASGSVSVGRTIVQNFGSGGSANVNTSLGNASVTTTWTKFTSTFTIPAIAGGTTIGDGHYTALLLNFPTNTTFEVFLANMKLEEGPVATDFEFENPAQEMLLCQRYYQTSYNPDTTPGTANQHFGVITGIYDGVSRTSDDNHDLTDLQHQFAVPMRVVPTVVLYNPITGATGEAARTISSGSTAYDVGAVANRHGFNVTMEDSGWSSDFNQLKCHFTASAEL